jgi:hypothetical protein
MRVSALLFVLLVASASLANMWPAPGPGRAGTAGGGGPSVETPNGTVSLSNSSCTTGNAHTNMAEDPDSPTGVWCDAVNDGTDHIMLQNFTDPAFALSGTTDAQVIALYVKQVVDDQGNAPTVNINIYDGVDCADPHQTGAAQTVNSATGELLTQAWTAVGVSGAADICVQLDCSRSGGAGGDRRSCSFDAIEWRAAG